MRLVFTIVLSCLRVQSLVGLCPLALPKGQVFSYRGSKQFKADSVGNLLTSQVAIDAAVHPVRETFALKVSLMVQSGSPTKPSFSESFSVETPYYINPATCDIVLWYPGLPKITVDRTELATGTKRSVAYKGGEYLIYLTRMTGYPSSLVSAERFGRFSPRENIIFLSFNLQLQIGLPTPAKPAARVNGASSKAVGSVVCSKTLIPGTAFRFLRTAEGGASIQLDLSVRTSSLRLQTIHKFIHDGFKHTHTMIARELGYQVDPQSCVITVTNNNFDSVDVVKESRGERIIFPSETEKYGGRKYLNSLLSLLGGTGLAGARVLGEVRSEDVIRFDANIDLKRY